MELINFLFWLLPIGLLVSIIYHFSYKLPRTEPSITDFHKTKSRLKTVKYLFVGFLGSVSLLGINKILNNDLRFGSKKEGLEVGETIIEESDPELLKPSFKNEFTLNPDDFYDLLWYGDDYKDDVLYDKGAHIEKEKNNGLVITKYKFESKNWDSTKPLDKRYYSEIWTYSNKEKFMIYIFKNIDEYESFFEKVEKKSKGKFRNKSNYSNYRDFIKLGDKAFDKYGVIIVGKGFVKENSAYIAYIFKESLLTK